MTCLSLNLLVWYLLTYPESIAQWSCFMPLQYMLTDPAKDTHRFPVDSCSVCSPPVSRGLFWKSSTPAI